MLRFLFRSLGVLMLAVAFAALIVDGTRSIAAGAIAVMPLGHALSTLSPDLFVRLHAGIEARAPVLWDPVLVTILLLPTWLVVGVLAIILIALTGRPRPKIGYARR